MSRPVIVVEPGGLPKVPAVLFGDIWVLIVLRRELSVADRPGWSQEPNMATQPPPLA